MASRTCRQMKSGTATKWPSARSTFSAAHSAVRPKPTGNAPPVRSPSTTRRASLVRASPTGFILGVPCAGSTNEKKARSGSPRSGPAGGWQLEVNPEDQLDDTASGIVSGGNVLVRVENAAEGSGLNALGRRHGGGVACPEEVGIVEGVEKLGANFKVDLFGNVGPLAHANVRLEERRPVDEHEVAELPGPIARLQNRGIRALVIAVEQREGHVPDGPGSRRGRLEHAELRLKLLGGDSVHDNARVVLVERAAEAAGQQRHPSRLPPGNRAELPALDQLVDEPVGRPPVAPAEREVIQSGQLKGMADVERCRPLVEMRIAQSPRLVEADRAVGVVIGQRFGEVVAGIKLQPLGGSPANDHLQGIVGRLCAVVEQKRSTAGIGVHNPEV